MDQPWVIYVDTEFTEPIPVPGVTRIDHATPSPARVLRYHVWRFAPVPFLGAEPADVQPSRWWFTEHLTLAAANQARDLDVPPFTKSYIEAVWV